MPSRPQVAPTEDWRQIELLARAPGQRTYELIRPVVLFGQSPAERAAETGAAERTLYRQVARFDQLGMAGLLPHRRSRSTACFPLRSAKRSSMPNGSARRSTCMRSRQSAGPAMGIALDRAIRGQAERRDGLPGLGMVQLGVAGGVAEEDDRVDTSHPFDDND